jgi:hypothetical protein
MSMMWFFSQPMAMEIGKRGQDEVLLCGNNASFAEI